MPDLRPYIGPTKLILAFDIGTIYSGISYCILVPHQIPEVLTVARFPAQAIAHADSKVPSILYYDKAGTARAVGAEVFAQDIVEAALTEGWTKAEWWKLHLCPKHLVPSLDRDDDLPPLPLGKSAVDILADFIKYLFDCSKTYIQECHPAFAWSSLEDSIEYIFTYPGGWAEQQCLYFRAIQRAGLASSVPDGRPRVHMATEGEAGLHFCVSHLLNGRTANHGAPEGTVIIDGGGGIINLSMFSASSNLIAWKEIAPAESRLQGSLFVTRRARALIQRKLEDWEHSNAEDIDRYTRQFDQTTKIVIETDEHPAYIRVAGRRVNSSRYCISSGQLKLSGKEATALFSDSVDAVIDAFEEQQKSASIPITVAFFIGGLSTNDWVWSRLQVYFMTREIRIYRPDAHVHKTVAKGAVLSFTPRDVGCMPPAKVIKEEGIPGKNRLRDRLTRLFTFTKKYNSQQLFSLTERRLADLGTQILALGCCRGDLSDPKLADQIGCEWSVAFPSHTQCTSRASEPIRDMHPLKGSAGQVDNHEPVITDIRAIDVALGLGRIPAGFYTVVHPQRPTTGSRGELEGATNQGQSALARCRKHNEKRDLGHSIEEFERTLSIRPLDHPCRATAQSNLAIAKLAQCRIADLPLDVPMTPHRDALAARPVGHPDRPSTLIRLSIIYLARFEKQRHEVDVAQAELLLHEAMALTFSWSYEKRVAIYLLKMSATLKEGPGGTGSQTTGIRESPSGSAMEAAWTLGGYLLLSFGQLGLVADLQQAISALEACARRCSTASDQRYLTGLPNLGVALSSGFEYLSELNGVSQANTVGFESHPDKPGRLDKLGISCRTRFARLGKLSDLDNAISRQRDVLDLTHDHPDKTGYLNDLDLEDYGSSALRDAVDPSPYDFVHLRGLALGTSFETRFGPFEPGDLEEVISSEALNLTPDSHPDKSCRLDALGNFFRTRFERLGDPHDLELATSQQMVAVDLTPDGHPHKTTHLNHLAHSFSARFEYLSDLEESFSGYKDAVTFSPDGHPDKPCQLNNLGNFHFVRFRRLGELVDLDRALLRQKEAVAITPGDHPHKGDHLIDLSISLLARFQCAGQLSDLEEAIAGLREVGSHSLDRRRERHCCLDTRGLERAISKKPDVVDLDSAACGTQITCENVPAHFRDTHGIKELCDEDALAGCMGCQSRVPIRKNFMRHIREQYLGHPGEKKATS